ncbi:MAG: AI-2E family transporter [Chitinophagaceae bacterium]|nr:AI-2E family transporter [Chitinophagaceae bacterium]
MMNAEYKNLSKLIYLAAGLFVTIWFAYEVIQVILLFFFAIVITIVLNAPTAWLEKRKVRRTLAALIVFFVFLIFLTALGWLIIPKIVYQVQLLIADLPQLLRNLNHRITSWLGENASINDQIQSGTGGISEQLPSAQIILSGISRYSLSFLGSILLFIFFLCLVAYMLINPRPLLELYLSFFTESKREKAAVAFANASVMTIGWMWSNVVAGGIRAVIVFFFLLFMNIPGVWIWAGVTFFAELIPRIGFYIMAVPPILIALSIDPVTAMWVAVFYLVLDEIMGDFVIPHIRASTMKIHPVSLLVMLLAMVTVFGLMGALIATPLTAFIKAYYEAFFEKKAAPETTKHQVDLMLYRDTDKKNGIRPHSGIDEDTEKKE